MSVLLESISKNKNYSLGFVADSVNIKIWKLIHDVFTDFAFEVCPDILNA